MYAAITRRKTDPARQPAITERVEKGLYPRMQKAPGFVAFYVVQETPELVVVVSIWESKAQFDAFWGTKESETWQATLEQMGSHFESSSGGEVILHTTPNP